MSTIVDYIKQLNLISRGFIFGIIIVSPFWYVDLYIIPTELIKKAPNEFMYALSFCFSLLYFVLNFLTLSIYWDKLHYGKRHFDKNVNYWITLISASIILKSMSSLEAYFLKYSFITHLITAFSTPIAVFIGLMAVMLFKRRKETTYSI